MIQTKSIRFGKNMLHYDLQTVTTTSLIHIVVLNMVEKKYPKKIVLCQLVIA